MRRLLVSRRGVTGVLVVLFLGSASTGCRPQKPIAVSLQYEKPEKAELLAAERAQGVVVHLAPVSDARSNQRTLGHTTVHVVPRNDVLTWVQEGILTLRELGFTLVLSGSDPPPPGYRIVARIDRVYVRSASASLRSSVVVAVEYYRGGVLQGTRLHHGDGVVEDRSLLESEYKFNEGSVLRALNMALAEAVEEIAATILELEGQ